MPTYNNSKWEEHVKKRYVGGCSGTGVWNDPPVTVNVEEKIGAYNDTISRALPSGPLVQNPTVLPLQYEQTKVLGFGPWTTQGAAHDYDCYKRGNWWLSKKLEERYTYSPSWPVGVGEPSPVVWPDWTLPMRLKIKDDVINLGASLAEYTQSVRMFGSAARGVADAVRSIRKLKFMKRRSVCSLTSAHLIHDYGIAPLLSDVYDTVETLRLRLEQPIYKRYHVFGKTDRWKYSDEKSMGDKGYVERYASSIGTQSVVAYVELDREQASRFTLGNPAEIAWEVTPFSFAIDWFIPIGDWLISLDAMKAVKNIDVSITQKMKKDLYAICHGEDNLGNYVAASAQPAYYKMRTHERHIADHIPFPPLPKPSLTGSIDRLFNAMSLLTTVRGCRGTMPAFRRRDFMKPKSWYDY
jgi:hypothetical protein